MEFLEERFSAEMCVTVANRGHRKAYRIGKVGGKDTKSRAFSKARLLSTNS